MSAERNLEYYNGFLKRAGLICERCLDPKSECKCLEDHMALMEDEPFGPNCWYCDSKDVAFKKQVTGTSEDGAVEYEWVKYACFECVDPVNEKGWEKL